jgi:hypothetical protein
MILKNILFIKFSIFRDLNFTQISTIIASTLIREWSYLFDHNETSKNEALKLKLLKFPLNSSRGTVRIIHDPTIYIHINML